MHPVDNRVEIIIFKNPLRCYCASNLRWSSPEKKLSFCFLTYLHGSSQRISFDYTWPFQRVQSIAFVGITIGYINLLLGENHLIFIVEDYLEENFKIMYVPFICGIKSNRTLKIRNFEMYPADNRVEIMIFKNPLSDWWVRIHRWFLPEKKIRYRFLPFICKVDLKLLPFWPYKATS